LKARLKKLCIQKEDGKGIQFFPPLRKVEPNQPLEKFNGAGIAEPKFGSTFSKGRKGRN
jgi:hypothetical protein